MSKVTQPLRDEHAELYPHIEQLRTVADRIVVASPEETRAGIEEAYAFLAGHLIPHAEAEDRALYPIVAEVLGAPDATATMRRDHVEIGRLADELGAMRARLTPMGLDDATARDLHRVLYGLYTLVGVHFAKEEEVYLPVLDARLTPEEGKALYARMEAAAGEVKKGAPVH